MKYKIIEMKYGSGESYYIVKIPGFFGWNPCPDISKILSDYSVPSGRYCYRNFTSVEDAENAITRNIEYMKAREHEKVIKIICSD